MTATAHSRPYPPAPRLELVSELFGQRIADPYRWLEDQHDPSTAAWCAAQDQLAARVLSGLPGRDRLDRRLAALMAAGSVSPPVSRGGRRFANRHQPGAERPVLVVQESTGDERILLDDPEIAVSGWIPSPDGTRLAYLSSTGGKEETVLSIMDVESGQLLDGPIDHCRFTSLAWRPDGTEFYYVRAVAGRRRVWHHRVGSDPHSDVEVFDAGLGPTAHYTLHVCAEGRWLAICARAGTAPRTDIWTADLRDGRVREVQREVDARAQAWVQQGRLYVLTDRDAPRRRLCVTDPAEPDYPTWRDVVCEDPRATLEHAVVFDDGTALAAHALAAVSRVSWVGADGSTLATVPLPGLGTVSRLTAGVPGRREAWIGYTDFTTPAVVLRWCAETPRLVTTWATAPAPPLAGSVQVTDELYRSADGTLVHAFVLSPAGRPDRPRPTVLTGYGGFGVSLRPAYSPERLAWVEAGGVYVVANLRGGGEHGSQWHQAGRRAFKRNSFDDLEAVAAGLAAQGWTTTDQLGIEGSSNGGLLVGAALTRTPHRYRAVSCAAPLLDMVRYHHFGLGPYWTDEYGSAERAEELAWLLEYSPYHRVTKGVRYPAVLLLTFESDTRVDPLHARKMCAALQHVADPDRPVLLRRDTGGHNGQAVSKATGMAVDQLTFFAAELGLSLSGPPSRVLDGGEAETGGHSAGAAARSVGG